MATTARKSRKSTVPANETKAQRFVRVATARTNKAIKAIDGLRAIRGSGYESNEEQRNKIARAIADASTDLTEFLTATGTEKQGAFSL